MVTDDELEIWLWRQGVVPSPAAMQAARSLLALDEFIRDSDRERRQGLIVRDCVSADH